MMNTKKYVSLALATAGILSAILIASPAMAKMGQGMGFQEGRLGKMGIFGKVSAISGSTITVTANSGRAGQETTTSYTVDASAAKVLKNGQASTLSTIAVGDTIMVQGTVTGTNVVAKVIRDGNLPPIPMGPAITGNGQPIVAGSVTAISGSTITITNKSNVTYTIDATNAKFAVRGATNPTIANISNGDNVVVQGAVNGNSVVAYSVIDQKPVLNNNNNGESKANPGFMGGFMRDIGGFFKNLFGF